MTLRFLIPTFVLLAVMVGCSESGTTNVAADATDDDIAAYNAMVEAANADLAAEEDDMENN